MSNTTLNKDGQPIAQMVLEEQTEEAQEIDLVALFYSLLEKWKLLLIAAVIGGLIAGIYTELRVTPLYKATAKLYVMNSDGAQLNLADLQIGTQLTQDYIEVFKNWHVHEKVIEKLELPYTYSQLSGMLSVSSPSNTRILYITVTSPSSQEAKLIADTYADVAREFIATRMDKKEPSIFEEALQPARPSSPNKSRNILLGIVLGLVAAGAYVVIQFIADDRIRTADDITKYVNLPTLGLMPKQKQDIDGREGKGGMRRRSSSKRKEDA